MRTRVRRAVPRQGELAAELGRIHDEGERLGIRVALRGTETAISQLRR